MGFFDEIKKTFKEDELDCSFRLECFGDSAIVVSGYKKIKTIDNAEVVLTLSKNRKLTISGAKLFIKQLEVAEVIIAGKIMNVKIE